MKVILILVEGLIAILVIVGIYLFNKLHVSRTSVMLPQV